MGGFVDSQGKTCQYQQADIGVGRGKHAFSYLVVPLQRLGLMRDREALSEKTFAQRRII